MPLLTLNDSLDTLQTKVWAELRKGAVQKKHPFHNVVFSSINDNAPASRWVVLRKVTEDHRFLIFTDARSEKVEQLRANPNATLLFYHNRKGVQVRVNGTVSLHHNDELTATYWPGVKGSPGVKSYQTKAAPGTAIPSAAEGKMTDASLNDRHFMIIEVIPHTLEVLQLGREGHVRAQFEKDDDDWKGTFLVP
jgi:pyridoxine/pyridoxamine 5'-phosphate oxidase